MKRLILYFFLCTSTLQAQTQIGQDIDGEAEFDLSGLSVSLSSDGSIVAIGAPENDGNGNSSGHVRVYSNQNSTWTQIGQDIDGESAGDQSGFSVSLSSDGNIVAIGAPANDGNGNNSGHVRVYSNQNGTWSQIGQDIDGESVGDQSGSSVSLSSDGTVVAIGATQNAGNGNSSGYVRVYSNQNSTWTQIGQDIDGESAGDLSGFSVSLSSDGNIVAIGAPANDGNGNNSGHVRVYSNQNGTWSQTGQDIDGESAGDESGFSVSLSSNGNIVAIGARDNDGNGNNSGHVRVYANQNGTWSQIGQDIDGEAEFDLSGISVRLSSDGSMVAIGAVNNDGNGNISGHVRVYTNQNGTWTQIGQDIDGEAEFDQTGRGLCLSTDGGTIAIGSRANDGNGSKSGHVRVFDLSSLLSSDNFEISKVSLVPNPATNQVTLTLESNIELQEIFIYNSIGQQIMVDHSLVINTSNLSNGLYFLQIKTNRGSITKKLIIE